MWDVNDTKRARSPDAFPLFPIDKFRLQSQFFPDGELVKYERDGFNNSARNFELFALHKKAEAFTDSISAVNSTVELLLQTQKVHTFHGPVLNYQALVLTNFFSRTVKTFHLNTHKLLNYIKEGLCFFAAIPGDTSVFFFPFLTALFNRVPISSPSWITPRMRNRFMHIITAPSPDRPRTASARRIYESAVVMLRFSNAPLGQRVTVLLAFLERVESMCQLCSEFTSRRSVPIIAKLFVASGNALLLETLLFLDRVFFGIECSGFFASPLRERWCLLMQALWSLVADDAALTRECRDALIT
jgi:hypothetical protein